MQPCDYRRGHVQDPHSTFVLLAISDNPARATARAFPASSLERETWKVQNHQDQDVNQWDPVDKSSMPVIRLA